MPTINQLSAVNTVTGADQVPIYASGQGDARKASFTTILEYVEQNFADPSYETIISAPTDGFNQQLTNSTQNIYLILNPAATLATGTITLPTTANSFDGQEIICVSTQTISSLTVNANGSSTVGVPSGFSATSTFTIRFNALQSTWYTIVNNPQISGADIVTTNATQTLTNKTFNLTDNTFAATSAQLAAAVTNETGSGNLVFSSSPALSTPNLGTVTSGNLAACTGYTLTNLNGIDSDVKSWASTPSSANLYAAMNDKTGISGSQVVFNASPTLTGKVRFNGASYMDMDEIASSSGVATVNLNNSSQFKVNLTENITTFNVTNAIQGQNLAIRFAQDGTGSRTIAFPSDFQWPGGVTPVLSTAANAVDVLNAIRVGSIWYGNLLKGFA
jgi:hypothetical protein